MPLYLGGGQSPTSSPTQGPLVDSVRQLTFTDSRGQTSGYSVWAAHIDPDEPVGMLVHLHGDGGYEYKNTDSWYLTGPSGILTTAQARNMILVVPFTPDREIDEINAESWWEDIVPHVGWAVELTQQILDTYSVDLSRVWFSGFSGGAEAISHQVIPHHLTELGAHAGGFVILGGGGPPYEITQTVISSPLKSRFPITWVAGENDRPEYAYDEYDGRGVAEAGEATYRAYGWNTNIVIVPGKQHLLVDGSQGLYGSFIGQAMDAAPVLSSAPGMVTEFYLGDRRCELYLGDQPILTYEVPPSEEVYQVSLTQVVGLNTNHSLVSVTVPAGETWNVRVQGTHDRSGAGSTRWPQFVIGSTVSNQLQGPNIDLSGTITAGNSTIALRTKGTATTYRTNFTGTVTISK